MLAGPVVVRTKGTTVEITDVRITISRACGGAAGKVLAFAKATIDNDWCMDGLRLIETPDGLIVAMPSRKLHDSCRRCGGKNHLRAAYCNVCGAWIDPQRAIPRSGVAKLHADVVFPVNPAAREAVEHAVVEAYLDAIAEAAHSQEASDVA